MFSLTLTIVDDLSTDSKKQAHNWISERKDFYDIKVGVNPGCSGASTAENISWLITDPFIEQNLSYYVIDDYWSNGFFDKQERVNILFILNHKNNHYDYFNNLKFFTTKILPGVTFNKVNNYELIEKFSGNGPNIYTFKKSG